MYLQYPLHCDGRGGGSDADAASISGGSARSTRTAVTTNPTAKHAFMQQHTAANSYATAGGATGAGATSLPFGGGSATSTSAQRERFLLRIRREVQLLASEHSNTITAAQAYFPHLFATNATAADAAVVPIVASELESAALAAAVNEVRSCTPAPPAVTPLQLPAPLPISDTPTLVCDSDSPPVTGSVGQTPASVAGGAVAPAPPTITVDAPVVAVGPSSPPESSFLFAPSALLQPSSWQSHSINYDYLRTQMKKVVYIQSQMCAFIAEQEREEAAAATASGTATQADTVMSSERESEWDRTQRLRAEDEARKRRDRTPRPPDSVERDGSISLPQFRPLNTGDKATPPNGVSGSIVAALRAHPSFHLLRQSHATFWSLLRAEMSKCHAFVDESVHRDRVERLWDRMRLDRRKADGTADATKMEVAPIAPDSKPTFGAGTTDTDAVPKAEAVAEATLATDVEYTRSCWCGCDTELNEVFRFVVYELASAGVSPRGAASSTAPTQSEPINAPKPVCPVAKECVQKFIVSLLHLDQLRKFLTLNYVIYQRVLDQFQHYTASALLDKYHAAIQAAEKAEAGGATTASAQVDAAVAKPLASAIGGGGGAEVALADKPGLEERDTTLKKEQSDASMSPKHEEQQQQQKVDPSSAVPDSPTAPAPAPFVSIQQSHLSAFLSPDASWPFAPLERFVRWVERGEAIADRCFGKSVAFDNVGAALAQMLPSDEATAPPCVSCGGKLRAPLLLPCAHQFCASCLVRTSCFGVCCPLSHCSKEVTASSELHARLCMEDVIQEELNKRRRHSVTMRAQMRVDVPPAQLQQHQQQQHQPGAPTFAASQQALQQQTELSAEQMQLQRKLLQLHFQQLQAQAIAAQQQLAAQAQAAQQLQGKSQPSQKDQQPQQQQQLDESKISPTMSTFSSAEEDPLALHPAMVAPLAAVPTQATQAQIQQLYHTAAQTQQRQQRMLEQRILQQQQQQQRLLHEHDMSANSSRGHSPQPGQQQQQQQHAQHYDPTMAMPAASRRARSHSRAVHSGSGPSSTRGSRSGSVGSGTGFVDGEGELHLGPGQGQGPYGHEQDLGEVGLGSMDQPGDMYHEGQHHPRGGYPRHSAEHLALLQASRDHIPCEGDERPINDDDLQSGNFVLGCGGTIAAPLQYEEVSVAGADGSVSTVLKPKRGQGYSCHHCIAAGELVQLATGESVPIEKVWPGAQVYGLGANGKSLVARTVTAVLDRGERQCVRLTFQDGRTVVCTPDHRFRCADGKWREAQQLVAATHGSAGTAVLVKPDQTKTVARLQRAAAATPVSSVELLSREQAGVRHVWDLSVPSGLGASEDLDSFTVNSLVVHNCKTTKEPLALFFCCNMVKKGLNLKKCRKKYCEGCLRRLYSPEFTEGGRYWNCPSCKGACVCASCERKITGRAAPKKKKGSAATLAQYEALLQQQAQQQHAAAHARGHLDPQYADAHHLHHSSIPFSSPSHHRTLSQQLLQQKGGHGSARTPTKIRSRSNSLGGGALAHGQDLTAFQQQQQLQHSLERELGADARLHQPHPRHSAAAIFAARQLASDAHEFSPLSPYQQTVGSVSERSSPALGRSLKKHVLTRGASFGEVIASSRSRNVDGGAGSSSHARALTLSDTAELHGSGVGQPLSASHRMRLAQAHGHGSPHFPPMHGGNPSSLHAPLSPPMHASSSVSQHRSSVMSSAPHSHSSSPFQPHHHAHSHSSSALQSSNTSSAVVSDGSDADITSPTHGAHSRSISPPHTASQQEQMRHHEYMRSQNQQQQQQQQHESPPQQQQHHQQQHHSRPQPANMLMSPPGMPPMLMSPTYGQHSGSSSASRSFPLDVLSSPLSSTVTVAGMTAADLSQLSLGELQAMNDQIEQQLQQLTAATMDDAESDPHGVMPPPPHDLRMPPSAVQHDSHDGSMHSQHGSSSLFSPTVGGASHHHSAPSAAGGAGGDVSSMGLNDLQTFESQLLVQQRKLNAEQAHIAKQTAELKQARMQLATSASASASSAAASSAPSSQPNSSASLNHSAPNSARGAPISISLTGPSHDYLNGSGSSGGHSHGLGSQSAGAPLGLDTPMSLSLLAPPRMKGTSGDGMMSPLEVPLMSPAMLDSMLATSAFTPLPSHGNAGAIMTMSPFGSNSGPANAAAAGAAAVAGATNTPSGTTAPPTATTVSSPDDPSVQSSASVSSRSSGDASGSASRPLQPQPKPASLHQLNDMVLATPQGAGLLQTPSSLAWPHNNGLTGGTPAPGGLSLMTPFQSLASPLLWDSNSQLGALATPAAISSSTMSPTVPMPISPQQSAHS